MKQRKKGVVTALDRKPCPLDSLRGTPLQRAGDDRHARGGQPGQGESHPEPRAGDHLPWPDFRGGQGFRERARGRDGAAGSSIRRTSLISSPGWRPTRWRSSRTAPGLDVIIVPVGGGSGAAGCCLAKQGLKPAVEVIGVQAVKAPAAYLSWKSGTIVTDKMETLAEGLQTKMGYELTQEILRKHLADFVLVSEKEMSRAILALPRAHPEPLRRGGRLAFGRRSKDQGPA